MSELYGKNEMTEGNFPLSLKLIYRYQREDPVLQAKLAFAKYQKSYFSGGHNTIEFIMYKDKIFIPHKIQKYVVK